MPLPRGLFVPPPLPLPPLDGLKLHLLGIRGHGMRTVGVAAKAAGARVDGCDRNAAEDPELARHGIAVAGNHDPAHVRGRRLIATTVTPADNLELRAALAAGTAHHRSDLLAALLRGRHAVAVTGTHGKGTVAALAGLGLADLGADPLVLLGVEMSETGSSVRIGAGPVIAEVDESDGSVARIAADVSVVTNVSFDHPQYERTVAETLGDLAVHVASVPAHGRVVIGSGRAAASLARNAVAPVWRLGKDFRAHVLEESPTGTSVLFFDPEGGTTTGRLRLRSVYLAEDAALAYAALRACGCPAEEAAAALGRLGGLSRRFEQVGVARGVTVFDDYGKHPDTIAATLEALRALRPRRLHALYEPHRVALVRRWGARFAAAFGRADHVVLLPINDRDFGSGEQGAADWYRRSGLAAELAAGADEAVLRIARRTRPGDVVCVFGVHDSMAATARALCTAIDGGSRWAVASEPLAGRAS